jgi:serine/threonine protein kinase/uncharacterized protein HemY
VQNKAQDDDLVMSLVEMALARPADQRASYLANACDHDSQLFEEVWKYVEAEERMKGFLLDPLVLPAPERGFEPGELLNGRFGIVREVGQGGMGIVYEAVDQRLEDRRIAIKCAKAGFHKRLPPEVRHATEISHPNVCKIFEIHTAYTDHGEIDFVTMEFLDGETLAERLRRGPLSEKEARTIAQQLCAGLAEAHRNGVIHGDLKSNNVILATAPDGAIRAVITDFGLARGSETAQRTAQSGTLGGTPDYMAPELWKGEKATVESDVYALGVILYELASGEKPFPSSPELPWEERLTRKSPAVNPKWDRVLGRCLDPVPGLRFHNADEIGKALAPRSRRWMLAAAAAVLLAVVSGVVVYEWAIGPKETVRLAVLPFESDSAAATLAQNLFRQTRSQLARIRGNARTRFAVVPEKEATHTFSGTLTSQNGKIVVHAWVSDSHSRVKAKDWQAAYAPGDLRYAPIALAGVVTAGLRLSPLAANAAMNAAASRDYWNGMYYLRRNSTLDQAMALMQRAVAEDPGSPLSYTGLAEAEWYQYRLTRDTLWLDRTRDALHQAEARNPDLAPVHRVAGYLDYANGFYEQAVAEYRRAIELEPNDGTTHMWLGKAYEDNNHTDEELSELQRAAQLDPTNPRAYQELGAFYLHRSQFEVGARYHKKAVDLAPEEPNLRFNLAVAYMNSGQFSDAERELRYSVGVRETLSADHTLGMALMYEGKDQEAIRYLDRASRLDSPPGSVKRYASLMYLGIAYRRLNNPAAANEANRRGLAMADADLVNPRDGYVRAFVAYFDAALGDHRAESEITQALGLSGISETRWIAVLTYEALGLHEKTLDLVSTSTAEQLADVNRWPDLAGLRQYPRFLQLLVSHQIE